MPFTSMVDITAIYNCKGLAFSPLPSPATLLSSIARSYDIWLLSSCTTANAFWAYLFAIWITKTDKLELKKACAVFLAIIGVVIISYGGAEASRSQADEKGVGSKLIGDLLAFVGSITFAGAHPLFGTGPRSANGL